MHFLTVWNFFDVDVLFSTRFLEAQRAAQFVVDDGLVLFFAWFIIRTFKWRKDLTPRSFFSWPSLKLAWSLMIFALGDAINRGLVWWTTHADNSHGWIVWSETFSRVAMIAAIINIWGALCALRAATPDSAGEKPWVVVMVAAIMFAVVVAFVL